MTPVISTSDKQLLNEALHVIFEALRELESDNGDIVDKTDNHVMFLILEMLNRLYTHSPSSFNSALGVLDNCKQTFWYTIIQPAQVQSLMDQTISDIDF